MRIIDDVRRRLADHRSDDGFEIALVGHVLTAS